MAAVFQSNTIHSLDQAILTQGGFYLILGDLDMHYRPYTPADFPGSTLSRKSVFIRPSALAAGMMRKLADSPYTITWIAEEDGQMAGFAIADWAAKPKGIVAYIQTIEVLPEMRRRGIASELLNHAEDSARAAGASAVWLHVDVAEPAAIRLYESHGYVAKGREEHYLRTPRRAALVYAKPFAAARAH